MNESTQCNDNELARVQRLSEEALENCLYINVFERKWYRTTKLGSRVLRIVSGGVAAAIIPVGIAVEGSVHNDYGLVSGTLAGFSIYCWGSEKLSQKLLEGSNHRTRILLGGESYRRTDENYAALAGSSDFNTLLPPEALASEDPSYLQLELFSEAELL